MFTFVSFDFVNTISVQQFISSKIQFYCSIARPRAKRNSSNETGRPDRNCRAIRGTKIEAWRSEIGRQTSRFEMLSAHTREIQEGVKRPSERNRCVPFTERATGHATDLRGSGSMRGTGPTILIHDRSQEKPGS